MADTTVTSDISAADQVYLVDLSNYMWRGALHKVHSKFKNASGRRTGHVYSFLRSMLVFVKRHIKTGETISFVWCLDTVPQFRHDLAEQSGFVYKDRPDRGDFSPIPDGEYLTSLLPGVTAVAPGYECDDVIASFATQNPGVTCNILSRDVDLWALSDLPNVNIWTDSKQPLSDMEIFNKFGAGPKDIPLIKTVFGDSSDTIPPVWPRLAKKKLMPFITEAGGSISKFVQSLSNDPVLGRDLFSDPQVFNRLAYALHIVTLNTGLDLDLTVNQGDQRKLMEMMDEFEIQTGPSKTHIDLFF